MSGSHRLNLNLPAIEFWENHLTSLVLSFLWIMRVITLVEADLAENKDKIIIDSIPLGTVTQASIYTRTAVESPGVWANSGLIYSRLSPAMKKLYPSVLASLSFLCSRVTLSRPLMVHWYTAWLSFTTENISHKFSDGRTIFEIMGINPWHSTWHMASSTQQKVTIIIIQSEQRCILFAFNQHPEQ